MSNMSDQSNSKHVMLNPNEIIIPKHYCRQYVSNSRITSLARSVEKNGMLHTPTVKPGFNGTFILCSGLRRILAAKMCGAKTVECKIIENIAPELIAIVENDQREDLDPIDEAHAYVRCIEILNLNQEEFADQIAKSPSNVSASVKLLCLPEQILERHRQDRKLSKKQLDKIRRLKVIEKMHLAYDKALGKAIDNQNGQQNGKPTDGPEGILTRASALLQEKAYKCDFSKISQGGMRDICELVSSTLGHLINAAMKKSNLDPTLLARSIGMLLLTVAGNCTDEKSLRTVDETVKETHRNIHAILRKRFSPLNIWQKIFRFRR